MTISTAAAKADLQWYSSHRSILYALLWALLSCAGVSTGGGGMPPPNNPVSYAVTVTGISGQLRHSTTREPGRRLTK